MVYNAIPLESLTICLVVQSILNTTKIIHCVVATGSGIAFKKKNFYLQVCFVSAVTFVGKTEERVSTESSERQEFGYSVYVNTYYEQFPQIFTTT